MTQFNFIVCQPTPWMIVFVLVCMHDITFHGIKPQFPPSACSATAHWETRPTSLLELVWTILIISLLLRMSWCINVVIGGLIYHSPAHLEGVFVKKLLKTSCHHIFPGCTDHEQLPVSRHRAGKKNSSERIISVWTLFGPCPCEKPGNWFLFFFRKEMESADTEWARALRAGGGEAAAQAHAGQRNIQIKINIC